MASITATFSSSHYCNTSTTTAFPSLSRPPPRRRPIKNPLLAGAATTTRCSSSNKNKNKNNEPLAVISGGGFQKSSSLLLQCGTLLASVGQQPAMAVTGNTYWEDDLTWTLIQSAIVAVVYLLIVPPVLMNWMRLRWKQRKFFEMYLQFMLVFIFFPGLLLWAPFLNFRKFPRDPTMKYPWSTPQDVSE